ncbi:hypothetical protein ACFOON_15100 [Novosphingobium piscinae]|uniref:Uncharacterized protein n=1 Tax=Novosphingobium piscinae TaxID=1507448 RepID=A0A7X1KPI9_9SPHN|nr:hypothetical protein [Novosphingobium piscinae]MBC2668772.1 hypothetical protein [Novosphingobium piscinae]
MPEVITDIPPGSKAFRNFPEGADTFDWSVIVSFDGDVLVLSCFNPGPAKVVPGPQEWRALARRLFPEARRVRYERRNRGSRWVEADIEP